MTTEELLEEQRQETREIIEMLLEDGSEPDAEYMIEHHITCTNFDRLEKAAVEAFKLGYEVGDAEEVDMEGGGVIFIFDAVAHHKLEVELLDKACEQLIHLCAKLKVDYEGWGTYYIGDDAIDMTGEEEGEETFH